MKAHNEMKIPIIEWAELQKYTVTLKERNINKIRLCYIYIK